MNEIESKRCGDFAAIDTAGTCTWADMRHPIECFDSPALQAMASALSAAVATVRLTGAEPDGAVHLEMARRIVSAAKRGDTKALALTEAALDGRWS